jgi:hypothetical protein
MTRTIKKPVNDRLFYSVRPNQLFAEEMHVVRVRLLCHLGLGIPGGRVYILFFIPPQGATSLLIFNPIRIFFQQFVHPLRMIGDETRIYITHLATFPKLFKSVWDSSTAGNRKGATNIGLFTKLNFADQKLNIRATLNDLFDRTMGDRSKNFYFLLGRKMRRETNFCLEL